MKKIHLPGPSLPGRTKRKNISCTIFLLVLSCFLFTVSQNPLLAQSSKATDSDKFELPTSFSYWPPSFQSVEMIIEKLPKAGDNNLLRKHGSLITSDPDLNNYQSYSYVAEALWRAGRIAAAKSMFEKIEQSKESFYTENSFHPSSSQYGYGSYSSNYKNNACFYLMKIFLEEKEYDKALSYLVKADKAYSVGFNCGTGQNAYENRMRNYYAACYRGLGQDEKAIALHLSQIFYSDDILISLLRKKYSQQEINRQLQQALSTISILRDELPTKLFTKDTEGRDSLVATYLSGTSTMQLFGKTVSLPEPDLEDGGTINRNLVIQEFKSSDFYRKLYKK